MNWLEKINFEDELIMNIAIFAGEIIVLFLVYWIISGVLRMTFRRMSSAVSNEKYNQKIDTLARLVRFILRLIFLLLCLGLIGVNVYQLYQGQDLKQFTLDTAGKLPPGYWLDLGISFAKVIALLIAARYVIRLIEKGLKWLKVKAVDYQQLKSNDESVKRFFEQLNNIQRVSVWLVVLLITANLFPFPEKLADYILAALNVYLIVSVAILIVNAIAAIVDSLDGLSKQYAETNNLLAFYQSLRSLIPLLRRSLEYIVYIAAATLALTQLKFISHLAEYGPGLIQAIGIIFIARVGIAIINLLIDRTYLNDRLPEEQRLRNESIYPIVKSILAAIIYFVAIVIILRALGFNPVPLLAGAGVLGMVIGLGAQSTVSDIVSGFLIIMENTYQIGDYIETRDASGSVEAISLRTTRIRSPNGQLYILRNGQHDDVVNYSREYTNAVVKVGVSHDSDLQKVYKVLKGIGEQIKEDSDDVLEPTEIAGIDDFSGPELIIKTVTQVKPGRHKQVERDLRLRIKQVFDSEKIDIPFEKRYKLA